MAGLAIWATIIYSCGCALDLCAALSARHTHTRFSPTALMQQYSTSLMLTLEQCQTGKNKGTVSQIACNPHLSLVSSCCKMLALQTGKPRRTAPSVTVPSPHQGNRTSRASIRHVSLSGNARGATDGRLIIRRRPVRTRTDLQNVDIRKACSFYFKAPCFDVFHQNNRSATRLRQTNARRRKGKATSFDL